MSEFETQPTDLDKELNSLLVQLGPDTPPAGFTARAMESIRPQVAQEPFRLHWSDFVPAFVLSAIGAVVLFFWLGAAGAHSIFEEVSSPVVFNSISDLQLVVLSVAIGLLVVAYPLLKGNWNGSQVGFFR